MRRKEQETEGGPVGSDKENGVLPDNIYFHIKVGSNKRNDFFFQQDTCIRMFIEALVIIAPN